MEKIKCLVVDDEDLARSLIRTYINQLDFLEFAGECDNPIAALNFLNAHPVDLLFLDIQMPEMKGTDFLRNVSPRPLVIFTTAYSEYALESYELQALDYLLKPIRFERFLKAANYAKKQLATPSVPSVPERTSLTLKSGYDLHKVYHDEILYIEGMREYVAYHTPEKRVVVHQSLKFLEATLPTDQFLRVHKSYIVRVDKVSALVDRSLLIGQKTIPVGKRYYELAKEKLFEI